jgi:xanthine/uracil permease
MKADRPLIVSVLLLAAGLATILAYCHGTTNLSAAYPLNGSTLHVEFTTIGPAVLGGLLLTALGLLTMVFAFLAAIVGEIVRLLHSDRPAERLLD